MVGEQEGIVETPLRELQVRRCATRGFDLLTGVGEIFAVRRYKNEQKCRNPRRSVSLSQALHHKGVSTYFTVATRP